MDYESRQSWRLQVAVQLNDPVGKRRSVEEERHSEALPGSGEAQHTVKTSFVAQRVS